MNGCWCETSYHLVNKIPQVTWHMMMSTVLAPTAHFTGGISVVSMFPEQSRNRRTRRPQGSILFVVLLTLFSQYNKAGEWYHINHDTWILCIHKYVPAVTIHVELLVLRSVISRVFLSWYQIFIIFQRIVFPVYRDIFYNSTAWYVSVNELCSYSISLLVEGAISPVCVKL